VRWGVSAIITDVTRTWLDLRLALHSTCSKSFLPFVVFQRHIFLYLVLLGSEFLFFSESIDDYEKCVSKYGRLFLWAPRFYSPILMFQWRVQQLAIERVAGPFDEFLALLN